MRRVIAAIVVFVGASVAAQSSASYRVTHTYELGGDGAWDYVVPSHDEHRVYIGRTNRVMVVDENDGHLIGEVMGIKGAHGTAISLKSGHGFATSGMDQSIVMFDLKTFQELARIPAALDADAIVYDAPSNRVFSLNGDGNSSHVVGSVMTPMGSRNMGIDQLLHRIFVAAATFAPPPAPPAGAPAGRGGRATVVPGTFKLLVIEPAS